MFCMRSMVGFYEKLHKGRGELWFQPLYFITASKIYGTRLSVFNSKFLSNYNLFVTEVITNTHYIPCRNSDKHSKKKISLKMKPPLSPHTKPFLLKCWWLFFRAFSPHATPVSLKNQPIRTTACGAQVPRVYQNTVPSCTWEVTSAVCIC